MAPHPVGSTTRRERSFPLLDAHRQSPIASFVYSTMADSLQKVSAIGGMNITQSTWASFPGTHRTSFCPPNPPSKSLKPENCGNKGQKHLPLLLLVLIARASLILRSNVILHNNLAERTALVKPNWPLRDWPPHAAAARSINVIRQEEMGNFSPECRSCCSAYRTVVLLSPKYCLTAISIRQEGLPAKPNQRQPHRANHPYPCNTACLASEMGLAYRLLTATSNGFEASTSHFQIDIDRNQNCSRLNVFETTDLRTAIEIPERRR